MTCAVELVFGLVAPIGTELNTVTQLISAFALRARLKSEVIQISRLFPASDNRSESGCDRYNRLMSYGDKLRESAGDNAAASSLAVAKISEIRNSDDDGPVVAIVRQLKTPQEVERLRTIYGSRLVVISCHSPRSKRVDTLARRLADADSEIQVSKFRGQAEDLILRDEQDALNRWGQNVRKTFPLADMFVNIDGEDSVDRALGRMLEILFGHPHHTPTRDEYGMYLAEAAALRSAALGRQVGAVISTPGGDIISVGCNEVPKAKGGLYWEGDDPDQRDFTLGFDTNDRFKEKLLGEIVRKLVEAKWVRRKYRRVDLKELIERLLYREDRAILAGTQVDSIIEFGRCVHAEMAAIVDAARRGVSVDQGTLYTTTFPCHECARHIVAAGIRRVVYRLPYPKSLVRELYPDSIDMDAVACDTPKVVFEPFVGIAPRRYNPFFTMAQRKDEQGNIVKWTPENSKLNLGDYFPDLERISLDEELFVAEIAQKKESKDGSNRA